MKSRLLLTLAVLTALNLCVDDIFAKGGPAIVDQDKAGKDYEIQGEYLSEKGEDGKQAGAQIIALGDGKFDAVGFVGGLPGAGWMRGNEFHPATGQIDGEQVVFQKKKKGEGDEHGILKDGTLTIFDADGTQIAVMKKTVRKSPTLGAKPPQGALVLFDGTSAAQFENGEIVQENLLGATGCWTKETFGDHTLHIEFRTPFMAESRGQGRGNSGVYIQERYELQVLDSFGLDGKNNECGGIYSISEPIVNMCLPPLTWQTYDIEFTAAKYEGDKKVENARVTIRHNGVLIHDDLELPHGTPGRKKEEAGPAGLFLQNHGNPVAFRNIWVVKK